MREVLPGLFHWTAFHQPIGREVSSYYLDPARIVIDPKLPDGGLDAMPGQPHQVVLTSGHHQRDAQVFADAFAIPIRASRAAAERLGDALAIEPFGEADEVAPGVTGIHIGELSPDEGALHLAIGDGALAFADGLNHTGGELGFFPDHLLGDDPERVKQGLRRKFRRLLDRNFDHLLFAHGDPLIGEGKAALRDFVTDPVGPEDAERP